jgi:hypothetical protein
MKNKSALQTLLTQSYESERSLRHFSYIASSELSTLLASALGELETADSKKEIEAAKKATERALFITKNLRYFSINSRPTTELTDLTQLVLDAVSTVENELRNTNTQFNVQVEASVFAIVDPIAFEQALLNLLYYSAQEIGEGVEGGIVHLQLQVLSNGIHINVSNETNEVDPIAELAPMVVESLGNDSMSVLGLQVARTILEAHSGKLAVFRSLSEGTHLICEIPFDSRINKPHLHHEKRRFKRVSVSFKAEITTAEQVTFPCRISILSLGGVFAAMSHESVARFRVENRIFLKIFTHSQTQIEIPLARIANTHPWGENSGVGIEFLSLDSKAKNLLAALLKAHAS